MAQNPINVCNMALAHIGDRRITRLDEEYQATNQIAAICAEFYDQTRKEVLGAMPWTFAESDAILSRDATADVIGGFTYTHVLPEDCIRVLRLLPASSFDTAGAATAYSGKIDKFKKVGRRIKSNYSELALEYVADVTDISLWHPHAVAAFARKLAHYLAGPLADSPQLSDRMLDLYEKVDLPNAQFYDAVQDKSNENSDANTRKARSPMIQERFSTGYGVGNPFDDDAT